MLLQAGVKHVKVGSGPLVLLQIPGKIEEIPTLGPGTIQHREQLAGQ